MRYDVIIVGGGLVGASLAVALKNSGLNIALIDAKPPTQEDPRLFALHHSSCIFLDNLSLWSTIQHHASAIHAVHVSRQGKFGSVRLQGEDISLPDLGHVIPAKVLEAALNEALSALKNCVLYRPAQLQTLEQDENGVTLIIQTEMGEKILQSSLVIGADGTTSTVRKQLGIDVDIFDYGQSALVTRTTLHRSHRHVAHERFLAQGTIAMLPLLQNECATIWSGDNAFISGLLDLPDNEFLEKLQQGFGYRLGRMKKTSQRHCFPLHKLQAKSSFSKGVFLLGNAAHTMHPIAAQGFNLALYEVAVIAHALHQQKILTLSDLERINKQIQKQQAVSMGVSHHLAKLFLHDTILSNSLIQTGMIGLDCMTPVKKRFISGMTGKSGHVPPLFMLEE